MRSRLNLSCAWLCGRIYRVDAATKELADCKARYKNLSQSEQETMQVNDTELPNLLETQIRARNVYETVVARYATNLRYLNAMKQREE